MIKILFAASRKKAKKKVAKRKVAKKTVSKKKKVVKKKKVIRKKKSSRSVKSKAPDSLSFLSDDQMNKFGENGIFIYAGGFILLFILMTFAISA
tara:strand:- start:1214 stop:1495 length:282 start_codon:yes stop_codon:yes gene_type:complete